jgi:regulation of enolase protein 1 (concanavalin A-like superfamily)
MVRRGELVEVFSSRDGGAWTLLRHSHFPLGRVLVGAMVNAPEGEGFTATFEALSIRPG